MNKKIYFLLLVLAVILIGCKKQQIEFLSTPPQNIQEKFNLATNHIINANALTEQAFVNENNVDKLSVNVMSSPNDREEIKKELNSAILKYEKSIEENNKAIELFNQILNSKDSSVNEPEMAKTAGYRSISVSISATAMECHKITISLMDAISESNKQQIALLSHNLDKCMQKRSHFEQYAVGGQDGKN